MASDKYSTIEFYTKFEQVLQFFKSISDRKDGEKSLDHVKYTHISDNDEVTNLKADLLKSRSIDEILDDIGLRSFHLKAFLLLGLLNITDSLEVSVLSIVLPRIKSDWNISSLLAGLLTISISIGIYAGRLLVMGLDI